MPEPGSSTSFTVRYPANTAAAPRTDRLIITPIGSAYEPTYEFRIVQLGTDSEVHTGDLILDSIEAITTDIQVIKHIIGSLRIGDHPSEGTDITNTALAELSLETITGDLIIRSTKLTSLTAFSELRRVGRDFYIGGNNSSDGNAMLGTLSGLNALEHVGRDLVVGIIVR